MATPPNAPGTPRPKRFDIELPLEFRPHDSDRWWQARTEDISANGILFRSRKRVPPKMPVDVKLQLPDALTGERGVRLLCSGYIVRSVEAQPPADEARVAATFLSYEVANGEPGLQAGLHPASLQQTREDVARLVQRLKRLLFAIQSMSELVARDPGNRTRIRSMALQTEQAAKEMVPVVQSLARTVGHGKRPGPGVAQQEVHQPASAPPVIRPRKSSAAMRPLFWILEGLHKKPKDSGGVTAKLHCPACHSTDVRPSRYRALERVLLRMLRDMRPYRCRGCWSRFYASARYFPDFED